MMGSIGFPNLGIHLKNVGQSFTVFGFEVAFYGMIIGIAVIAGILLAVYEAKRTGQNPDTYYDLAIYAVIFSVIGARLYYVIFAWEDYKGDLASIVNLRQGGLAIYGAVIAAVITVTVYCKVKKLSFRQVADTAVLGLVLGQIIGRWGNFFNREAFGSYTDGLLAMRLPWDTAARAVPHADVLAELQKKVVIIGDGRYIQVHPTFLYESLWNLAVLIFLLCWRKHKKFEGEIFLLYLFGYGVGRFWIEGLRTDPLLIGNTGLAVSQVLAAVLVVVSATLIVLVRLGKIKLPCKKGEILQEEVVDETEEDAVEETEEELVEEVVDEAEEDAVEEAEEELVEEVEEQEE